MQNRLVALMILAAIPDDVVIRWVTPQSGHFGLDHCNEMAWTQAFHGVQRVIRQLRPAKFLVLLSMVPAPAIHMANNLPNNAREAQRVIRMLNLRATHGSTPGRSPWR